MSSIWSSMMRPTAPMRARVLPSEDQERDSPGASRRKRRDRRRRAGGAVPSPVSAAESEIGKGAMLSPLFTLEGTARMSGHCASPADNRSSCSHASSRRRTAGRVRVFFRIILGELVEHATTSGFRASVSPWRLSRNARSDGLHHRLQRSAKRCDQFRRQIGDEPTGSDYDERTRRWQSPQGARCVVGSSVAKRHVLGSTPASVRRFVEQGLICRHWCRPPAPPPGSPEERAERRCQTNRAWRPQVVQFSFFSFTIAIGDLAASNSI